MRAAGVNVQLGRDSSLAKAACVLDALVSTDVEFADFDVGVGKSPEVGDPGWSSCRRDVVGCDSITEKRAPARVVVLVGPTRKGNELQVRRRRPVVKHRIDQYLTAYIEFSLTGQDGNRYSESAAGAVTHNGDPRWIHPELARGRAGEPGESGKTVLNRGRVGVFWR